MVCSSGIRIVIGPALNIAFIYQNSICIHVNIGSMLTLFWSHDFSFTLFFFGQHTFFWEYDVEQALVVAEVVEVGVVEDPGRGHVQHRDRRRAVVDGAHPPQRPQELQVHRRVPRQVLLERVDPTDELVAVRHADRVRACTQADSGVHFYDPIHGKCSSEFLIDHLIRFLKRACIKSFFSIFTTIYSLQLLCMDKIWWFSLCLVAKFKIPNLSHRKRILHAWSIKSRWNKKPIA